MTNNHLREEDSSFSGIVQTHSTSGLIPRQIQETSGVFCQKQILQTLSPKAYPWEEADTVHCVPGPHRESQAC